MNINYEFNIKLKNHEIEDKNIYRLYYIEYYRMNNYKDIGMTNWPYRPFMLPDGMNKNDAFKVLSYLTDYIEKDLNLESCSLKSVCELDNIINLDRLGFKRINYPVNDEDIIDLFTVNGRLRLFKNSAFYNKYFEWYTKGITFEEVRDIYNKCGIEFYDLVNQNNVKSKKLVK